MYLYLTHWKAIFVGALADGGAVATKGPDCKQGVVNISSLVISSQAL
jgi:hypothetical protein